MLVKGIHWTTVLEHALLIFIKRHQSSNKYFKYILELVIPILTIYPKGRTRHVYKDLVQGSPLQHNILNNRKQTKRSSIRDDWVHLCDGIPTSPKKTLLNNISKFGKTIILIFLCEIIGYKTLIVKKKKNFNGVNLLKHVLE